MNVHTYLTNMSSVNLVLIYLSTYKDISGDTNSTYLGICWNSPEEVGGSGAGDEDWTG